MRPLRTDGDAPPYRPYVIDLETAGFGEPGRRPEQLLSVLYDGERHEDRWGARWGGDERGPMVAAIDSLFERGEPFDLHAHYGGGFDFRFVMEWLFETRRARAEVVNAGSLVLCVAGKVDGVPFRLVDTIRLLLAPLRKIGKWLGRPKGHVEHAHDAARCRGPLSKRCGACLARTAEGRARLSAYCRQDCGILWDGLEYVKRLVLDFRGLRPRTTLAATSTACVRARLTDETVAECDLQVDLDAEDANYGGRTEYHAEECGGEEHVRLVQPAAELYDVQSMYPWAMSAGPLPWRHRLESKRYREGQLGFAEVEVEVPEDCALPLLPYRVREGPEAGRLYFPTGRWRASFVCEELDRAAEVGAARILKVHRQHRFDGSTVLRDFALEVWDRRESTEGFEREFWKIFANSCYGKLVERREKRRYVANPESAEGLTCVSLRYGLHFREVTYQPGFRHVVAGASVTARSRVRLHRIMSDVLRRGGRVYYCDTDSVICSGAKLKTGKGLGDLDLQHLVCRGVFAAAKFYALWVVARNKDGSAKLGRDGRPFVKVLKKGKGLPRMPLADHLAAMRECGCGGEEDGHPSDRHGRSVEVNRTMGFREALARRGTPGFERSKFTKVHRFGRAKRADRGTRPWRVEELAA